MIPVPWPVSAGLHVSWAALPISVFQLEQCSTRTGAQVAGQVLKVLNTCGVLAAGSEGGDDDDGTRRSGRVRKPRRDFYAEEEEREEARRAQQAATGGGRCLLCICCIPRSKNVSLCCMIHFASGIVGLQPSPPFSVAGKRRGGRGRKPKLLNPDGTPIEAPGMGPGNVPLLPAQLPPQLVQALPPQLQVSLCAVVCPCLLKTFLPCHAQQLWTRTLVGRR